MLGYVFFACLALFLRLCTNPLDNPKLQTFPEKEIQVNPVCTQNNSSFSSSRSKQEENYH